MIKTYGIFVSILLVSILSACNLQKAAMPSTTDIENVATMVVQTMAAFTQAAQKIPVNPPTLQRSTDTQPVSLPSTLTPTFAPTLTATLTPDLTQTLELTDTLVPKPGSIEGSISGYPYGSLPKLVIVAFGQEPPYNYSYLITSAGDTSYSMSSSYLIPGKFQVVAYDASNHSGGCPAVVTVKSDQSVICNITNWGGGYPAKPSGVPNP